MVVILNYTFPAVQIVYHLATLGNVTGSVLGLDQSPPQQNRNLPDGYIAYPDLGLAYKYHSESALWAKARNVCQQEGAQLAVMDSFKKHEFLRDHGQPNDTHHYYTHAGIIRVGSNWINVNTGSTVTSLPWDSGYPDSTANNLCAYVDYIDSNGLKNDDCSYERTYACELPISVSYTITAN